MVCALAPELVNWKASFGSAKGFMTVLATTDGKGDNQLRRSHS